MELVAMNEAVEQVPQQFALRQRRGGEKPRASPALKTPRAFSTLPQLQRLLAE